MTSSHSTPAALATIALLHGDGIGPEVVDAARSVLDAAAARFDFTVHYTAGLIGGAAIDATGQPLPDDTRTCCLNADAVLLGAVGGPAWDNPSATVRPEQGLLALRQALGVFANIRPVLPFPSLAHASPLRHEIVAGVDLVVVRELTGGIYFGAKHHEVTGAVELASDLCVYTTPEIERVVRVGAELARARRRRLTSVDKANVLESSRLWRRVTSRVVAEEFPDVAVDHMLVDSCAMHLIQSPSRFDVIVTDNMFGDILTDEAAVISGSIGLLPSASLGLPGTSGRRRGLYEPIHGSAPDIVGTGRANPIGAILSAAMLLRHSLGLEDAARAIEDAVRHTIDEGTVTPELAAPATSGSTTAIVASRVAELLEASASMAGR